MLQGDVASIIWSETSIVLKIVMVWLWWLSPLMARIQICMATTILMVMIAKSDCILCTIDCWSMDVAFMMDLIVIH